MNRILLALALGLAVSAQAGANDASDRRLAELLQPRISYSVPPGQPKMLGELRAVPPGLAMEKFKGQPPRPEFAAAKPVRPHDPAEPAPLDIVVQVKPGVPAEIVFVTYPVVAVPVVDVNAVPTLPNLARPTLDRAPLTDATLEASIAAALKAAIPLRRLMVPFAPLNLPDPFELQGITQKQFDEDFQPMVVPPHILVRPIEPKK